MRVLAASVDRELAAALDAATGGARRIFESHFRPALPARCSLTTVSVSAALARASRLLSTARILESVRSAARSDAITSVCCENTGDDDCASGFPTTCESACADLLAPFWEECGDLISGVSASTFAFDISAFGAFAGVCTNTRSLAHFANGVCSNNAAELQSTHAFRGSCCSTPPG